MSVVVQLCLNQNRNQSKMAKIKTNGLNVKKLLSLCKQKLRIKKSPKKLYLASNGMEINNDNIMNLLDKNNDNNLIKGQIIICISLGEPFIGLSIKKKSTNNNDIKCVIRYMINDTIYENEAQKQLILTSKLKGMLYAIAQPDFHPGKGYPIGVSLISHKYVYPYLIGTDIGCGMSLIELPVNSNQINVNKKNKWVGSLKNIDGPYLINNDDRNDIINNILKSKIIGWPSDKSEDGIEWNDDSSIDISDFNNTLGTIGHGNHFAELQAIEKVVDQELFKEYGLNENSVYLMIHSGSRGFGKKVLDIHLNKFGTKGLEIGSDDFKEYMGHHNNALKWARKNRTIIAQRFINDIGIDFDKCKCILDIYHNYLAPKSVDSFTDLKDILKTNSNSQSNTEPKEDINNGVNENKQNSSDPISNRNNEHKESKQESSNIEINHDIGDTLWIHRKGAAPSDEGLIVIPGSRGAFSYIVKPQPKSLSGFSVAHGAGRQWMRSKAIKKMSKWFPNHQQLTRTNLGSFVICENKDLLYEEAPQAYKDITTVINDLESYQLINVVAILRPIITYKMRK